MIADYLLKSWLIPTWGFSYIENSNLVCFFLIILFCRSPRISQSEISDMSTPQPVRGCGVTSNSRIKYAVSSRSKPSFLVHWPTETIMLLLLGFLYVMSACQFSLLFLLGLHGRAEETMMKFLNSIISLCLCKFLY